jgi:thiamine-phosphate pyrophosphorylase
VPVDIPLPCLMLITDRLLCRNIDDLEQRVLAAVRGGVNIVQIREKDLRGYDLLGLARRLHDSINEKAILTVNGCFDVALNSGADGVHLPEDKILWEREAYLGYPDFLFSRSVHSVRAATEAENKGIHLLEVGTMFSTPSKQGKAPEGPKLLQAIRKLVSVPCIGVGGINKENVASVMHAGAAGSAVIRSVLMSDDPERAASQLYTVMERAYSLTNEGREHRWN